MAVALLALTSATVNASSPSPSAPGGDTSVPQASGAPATDPSAAFKAYAACMKDHGIDLPDPAVVTGTAPAPGGAPVLHVFTGTAGTDQGTPAGAGTLSVTVGAVADGATFDGKDFQAADEACRDLLPAPDVSSGTSVTIASTEDVAAFNACMTKQGIDLPDPTKVTGSDASTFVQVTADGSVDPNDPSSAAVPAAGLTVGIDGAAVGGADAAKLQAALEACSKLLPDAPANVVGPIMVGPGTEASPAP